MLKFHKYCKLITIKTFSLNINAEIMGSEGYMIDEFQNKKRVFFLKAEVKTYNKLNKTKR